MPWRLTGPGLLALVFLLLFVAGPSSSATYLVRSDGSGDFPTIQAALDAAVGGDEVVLADGTFRGLGNVNLRFFGKAVTLRSQSGNPASCVIDCQHAEVRGLVLNAGETRSTRVESITVTNSLSYQDWPGGGGAYCHDSSPTLYHCVFTENFVLRGYHMSIYGGSPLLQQCTFYPSGTGSGSKGGAIYTEGSTLEIEDCVFYGNFSSEGGAIWSSEWATLRILRTVFTANGGSGAALWCHDSTVELTGCTLSFNLGYEAQVRLSGDSHLTADHTIIAFGDAVAFQCFDGSTAALSCCDVYGHQGDDGYGNEGSDWVGCLAGQQTENNNLCADPIFCNMAALDPHLRADSPCAESNNATCGQIGALGVACDGPVPVSSRSWGQIKALFRSADGR